MSLTLQFGSSRTPTKNEVGQRMIALHQLPAKGICFHPNYLRRMWERGEFPRPTKLSPRRLAWPETTIDRWIESKIAESAIEKLDTVAETAAGELVRRVKRQRR